MRLAALLALLVPAAALANGGPVAWTLPSGTGTLAPIEESRVTLVSEKLTIRLEDDGSRFRARAEYVLSNPGPPATVKYGVPVFWLEEGEYGEAGPAPRPTSIEDVVILLGDERPRCALEDSRWVDPEQPGLGGTAWCTATLTIPSGAAVPLTLEVRGWYRFTDMAYSKSVFTEFGERTLRWELAPAGHWAGRPSLTIEIDPGRWGDRFRVDAPAGFGRRGSTLTFSSPAADLKALDAVTGKLAARPALAAAERWRAKAAPATKVRVSSTLPARGGLRYDAGNLLDGDPSTAWCAARGAKGPPFIELALPAAEGCWFELVLVPGYAKSPKAWLANGRIRAVRHGPCGRPAAATAVIAVPAIAHWDEAAFDLPAGILATESCVRLELTGIDPGPDGDVCVSELKPIRSCG
ncbi:MAG: hypothetical protein QM704_25800 [Anaeromyxobacteraceae bacterium]